MTRSIEVKPISVEYIDHMGDDKRVANVATNGCVFPPRTKTHWRIVEAKSRGYLMSVDGTLQGPKGRVNFSRYGKQRYPTFSTNWGGFVFGVPVHMFAAYCFFGDSLFEKGVCVRHLNGNTMDNSIVNLCIGTPQENALDKSPEKRKAAAIAARKSQPYRSAVARLSKQQYIELLDLRNQFPPGKLPNGVLLKWVDKFKISSVSLNNAISGKTYKDWYEEYTKNAAH